ncbi:MAG: ATP-dependent DNA ligase [Porphyrobacter sp.]|nr:ATP-dependent DNA ligase [Porphyrobacter sp.]
MAARKQHGASPVDPGSARSPFEPMEALLVDALPEQPGWFYEPKWDGFRALVQRDGDSVELWSKSGKPLGRYFPEIVELIRSIKDRDLLLDGELVVPIGTTLAFEALQARLHPAASRIAKLSRETPAQLILFDCLRRGKRDILAKPLTERRTVLEHLHASIDHPSLVLSPFSTDLDQAMQWLALSGQALDGVIAKPSDAPYAPSERAMRKVKQIRTADCVVGGYREADAGGVASLLLGLFNADRTLDLVGFTSSFAAAERLVLARKLMKLRGGPGFTGKAPGGPSRWSPDKTGDYIALKHELVVEVAYDQVTGGRFRHGTKMLRWRPDKAPEQCTRDQLTSELRPSEVIALIK